MQWPTSVAHNVKFTSHKHQTSLTKVPNCVFRFVAQPCMLMFLMCLLGKLSAMLLQQSFHQNIHEIEKIWKKYGKTGV